MRRRLAASCAVLCALAAQAAADGVDLSSLADACAAGAGAGGPLAVRYRSLAAAVSKPDRPGLADDFAKMQRAAREARGRLTGDAALAAAVSSCLDEGLGAALDAADAAACDAAAFVGSRAVRRRADTAVRAARKSLDSARDARDAARDDLACGHAVKSAKWLASALAAAEAQVRRESSAKPSWHTVLGQRAGALWSVTSTPGPRPTIYVVGSDDGGGPQFLHGRGDGWAQIPLGGRGALVWCTLVPGGGVWACGDDGRVIRYDPETGGVTDHVTGTTAKLWGVWGAAPDDVWTVGVDAAGGAVLRHFDGVSWTAGDVPAADEPHGLYKVWGRSADDVWACGEKGAVLHWDGASWTSVASGVASDLLTVHGDASHVTVVGAVFGATMIQSEGAGPFAPQPLPADAQSLSGVFLPSKGDAWAVGYLGTVLRREKGRWRVPSGLPDVQGLDLHAVHVDDTGAVWIAGGNLFRGDDGVLLQYGPRAPSPDVLRVADFDAVVQPVFTARCSEAACHGGLFLSEDLDLSEAAASRAGLARASTQAPLRRVVPGRPSASYLWRKLEGTHLAAGGSGDPMPQAGDPIPASDLDAVRAWILSGGR